MFTPLRCLRFSMRHYYFLMPPLICHMLIAQALCRHGVADSVYLPNYGCHFMPIELPSTFRAFQTPACLPFTPPRCLRLLPPLFVRADIFAMPLYTLSFRRLTGYARVCARSAAMIRHAGMPSLPFHTPDSPALLLELHSPQNSPISFSH